MLNYQRVPQNPQLFSDHSFFVGDSGWMACGAFKRQIRADGSCNMSNGSCATRSDWLVIGCFKKRWNIYRSNSHFLFDYIDMTYIFIWRYDLYDLYEDMTSSPQSIGMIVPGSLERLNHKNNLKKKLQRVLRVLGTYAIFGNIWNDLLQEWVYHCPSRRPGVFLAVYRSCGADGESRSQNERLPLLQLTWLENHESFPFIWVN